MAAAFGVLGGIAGHGSGSGSFTGSRNLGKKGGGNQKNGFRVFCVSSSPPSSLMDHYKTLRVQPGASESEVKKAFRRLALQYHPDVCRGNDCGIQFHQINEAYNIVMSKLQDETTMAETIVIKTEVAETEVAEYYDDDEDWIGYEGAWNPRGYYHAFRS